MDASHCCECAEHNDTRIAGLASAERDALAALLIALIDALPEEIDVAGDTDTLLCTIAALQNTQDARA